MSHRQAETTDKRNRVFSPDRRHRMGAEDERTAITAREEKESERIQPHPTNGDICWKTPRRSDESTTDACGGACATAVSYPTNRTAAWRRGSLSIRRSLRSMMREGPLASTAGVWPGRWGGASGDWANGERVPDG